MNFKFLKATFASLLILTSTANAGIIEVDFTALDEAGDFNEVVKQNEGTINVVDDVLTLSTNSWFSVDLIDAIGVNSLNFDNTILSFDFMTTGTAEISGIATSNTDLISSKNTFNLLGTQDWWGLDTITYNDINNWVHFDINLSDYMSGDFSKLMFVNDCDFCLGDVTTSFKNMTLTSSQIPEPTTLALFALAAFGLTSRKVKK